MFDAFRNVEYVFLHMSKSCILNTVLKRVFLLAVVVAVESLNHLYIKKSPYIDLWGKKVEGKNARFYYFSNSSYVYL